jgi:hypothetical protein
MIVKEFQKYVLNILSSNLYFHCYSEQVLLPNLRILHRYTPGSCLCERDETRGGTRCNSMMGGTHDSRL